MNLKKNENKSVADGRRYIASYVEFIHYIEELHLAIKGHGGHHED